MKIWSAGCSKFWTRYEVTSICFYWLLLWWDILVEIIYLFTLLIANQVLLIITLYNVFELSSIVWPVNFALQVWILGHLRSVNLVCLITKPSTCLILSRKRTFVVAMITIGHQCLRLLHLTHSLCIIFAAWTQKIFYESFKIVIVNVKLCIFSFFLSPHVSYS